MKKRFDLHRAVLGSFVLGDFPTVPSCADVKLGRNTSYDIIRISDRLGMTYAKSECAARTKAVWAFAPHHNFMDSCRQPATPTRNVKLLAFCRRRCRQPRIVSSFWVSDPSQKKPQSQRTRITIPYLAIRKKPTCKALDRSPLPSPRLLLGKNGFNSCHFDEFYSIENLTSVIYCPN